MNSKQMSLLYTRKIMVNLVLHNPSHMTARTGVIIWMEAAEGRVDIY